MKPAFATAGMDLMRSRDANFNSGEKMKIAILVPLFLPRWLAGTEIATYNIAKHLVRRGHDVYIITSFDDGLPKTDTEYGFCVYRVALPKVRFLGITYHWLRILLLLRKIDPDLVHAQNIGTSIPGLMAKKLLKKPYFVWGQGSDVYLPWQFKILISKLVLPNANAVIALTEDMKREMQKICDRDVYVIPNGVDLTRFEGLSKENARARLHIKQNEGIITFVGTLRPVKGMKYLIQAMNIIRQENINARLMLVGDGEERQSLQELVRELDLEDRVTFVGKVPNEEVPEYMIASDIFALPSLSESFGIVNLEAMASGLPIVATNVGGLPELIKNGQNGFLVEPKNSKKIAEKILLLLEDDELRERISRNNKEKAKGYSWERVVGMLEEIYRESLINRRAAVAVN